MSLQYQWKDKIYKLVNCTKEEIPSHSERVLSYWEQAGENPEDHYRAMEISIDSGIAFKVIDNTNKEYLTVYFSYYKDSRQCVLGHVFWTATKFALAMGLHHVKNDLEIASIFIMPLLPNYIPYSFLVDNTSVKLFHAYHQLVIISTQTKKCNDFLRSYFDTDKVKEL